MQERRLFCTIVVRKQVFSRRAYFMGESILSTFKLPTVIFLIFFCRLLILFSKSFSFKKNLLGIPSECETFCSRLGPTFCRYRSGSTLFTKFINIRYKSPLARKGLIRKIPIFNLLRLLLSDVQEVFHVYLNTFEIVVTHLFLKIFCNTCS